jgi:hypothetical protein
MRTALSATMALSLACACYRGASNEDTARADTTPATPSAPSQPAPAADSPRAAPAAPAPITLRTDRETYRSEATVTLTITNASDKRYTFNPCTRIVERETGGSWTEVREERMCTMIAHLLEPRATRTEKTELGTLAPGRYRLVVAFSEDTPAGGAVRALSAPITVTD